MAQEIIIKILKKDSNKWFSAKEIAEQLNVSVNMIRINASKLCRSNLIECNKVNIPFLYKYKEIKND